MFGEISPKLKGKQTAAFSAALSSNQTVSANVITKLQCNTKNYDSRGWYDNVTNFRYQPQVAGKYHFTGYLSGTTTTTSAAAYVAALIYKNGVEVSRVFSFYGLAATLYTNVNIDLSLNGLTDYVEMYGVVGDGTIIVGGETSFHGFLIETA